MDDVAELPSFLLSGRPELRSAAAEAAAALSAHQDSLVQLAHVEEELLPPLLKLLQSSDMPDAATNAGAALVNMAQLPATRQRLIALKAVDASVVGSCADGDVARMSCMLLANLTQFEAATKQLLAHPQTPTLLTHFAAERQDSTRYEHMPYVLTQLLTTPAGRLLVLKTNGAVGAMLTQLNAGEEALQGSALALRNLCFEAAADAPARAKLLALRDELIAHVAARLHVPSATYSNDDRSSFSPLLSQLLAAERRCDANDSTRLALTEALLLLTAAPDASEAMRSAGIYPVLREAHLAEEDEKVKDANEHLVSEFYLKDVPPPRQIEAGADPALEPVLEMDGDVI